MKKMFIFAIILGMLAVLGWGYWKSLDDARRWLLFNEKLAEKHAVSLLKGDTHTKLPDELIDVQISTYPGWVLFSPHTGDHSFILAYAPGKRPAPLAADGELRQWQQVNKNWYELSSN